MRSRVPWSVKGVNQEARTAAKEAAHQSGQTLGQWLNEVIADASQRPTSDSTQPAEPTETSLESYRPPPSAGAQEFASLQSSLAEIAERFEQTEQRNQHVLSDLSQAISGFAKQLDETRHRISENPSASIKAIAESQTALLHRIEILESERGRATKISDAGDLDKVLEKMISLIEASERRTASGMKTIEDAMGHLTRRLEVAEGGSILDKTEFEEHLEQTLKHIRDQIERRENAHADQRDLIRDLEQSMATLEKSVRRDIDDMRQKLFDVTSTFAEIEEKRKAETRRNRIEDLSDKCDRIGQRLAEIEQDQTAALHKIVSRLDALDGKLTNAPTAEPAARPTQTDTDRYRLKPLPKSPDEQPKTSPPVAKRADQGKTAAPEKAPDPQDTPKPEAANNPTRQLVDRVRSAARFETDYFDDQPSWGRRAVWGLMAAAFLVVASAGTWVFLEETDQLSRRDRPEALRDFFDVIDAARDRLGASISDRISGGLTSLSIWRDSALPGDNEFAASKVDVPTSRESDDVASLEQAANAGDADAEFQLGLKYFVGDGTEKNVNAGLELMTRAAEQGLATAQYRLGSIYEQGNAVEQDYELAFRWYRAAAEQALPAAMHNLAVMYVQGTGTDEDFAEAFQWFSKAAALGITDSQFNLALLLNNGFGTERDPAAAYKWFGIAARQGDTAARPQMAALEAELSLEQLVAARKAIENWQPVDTAAAF